MFSFHGENCVDILAIHYPRNLPAESVQGTKFNKEAVVSTDVHTGWKTYCCFLSNQPREELKTQLMELATNETLIALLPMQPTQAGYHPLATPCWYRISQKIILTNESNQD